MATSELDVALIDRLLAGDTRAFETLIARYHAQLVRLARLFVRDEETAREVAQDAWVGVIAGLPRFERRSTLQTWIFRILVNTAKSRGVREQRSTPVAEVDSEPANGGASWLRDEELSPEKQLLDREALDVVARALWSLPETQRAVVVLHDIQELDSTAVSHILGVTESNLRVLHHRARNKLRQALEQYAA